MATKKQKREAAEAKRAKFEAEMKTSGLAAQNRDRAEQTVKQERMREEIESINQRHREILDRNGVGEVQNVLRALAMGGYFEGGER